MPVYIMCYNLKVTFEWKFYCNFDNLEKTKTGLHDTFYEK